MYVTKRSGEKELLNVDKINRCVQRAAAGISDVSVSEIVLGAKLSLYDGIKTEEIDKAMILSAKSRIEQDPNYSRVAARLLLNTIYKEVFNRSPKATSFEDKYRDVFYENVVYLVENGILSPKILEVYDLDELAEYIKPERDLQFKYIGLQRLYDKYLIRYNDEVMELPQGLWMRIACGVCYNEDNPTQRAKEFYDIYSQFLGIPSTPTLFNAGTIDNQLASCYISCCGDSDDGIMGTIHNQAKLSKFSGGCSVYWGKIRASGATIKRTRGKSSGPIPFIKILNDTICSFNQSGKRLGACAVYQDVFHYDIEDFLELRKAVGDERRRAQDLHIGTCIPDLFMQRVKENGDWYLFCPHECPELHDSYGEEFEKNYLNRCLQAEEGLVKLYKKVKAKEVWKKIIREDAETGEPYLFFRDTVNNLSVFRNKYIVYQGNLCQEIVEPTIPTTYINALRDKLGETAVCSLASINLKEHCDENGVINYNKLATTVYYLVRHIDNTIDLNFYPIDEARNSHLKNRFAGLGYMGFQDVLHLKGITYDSEEAVRLADELTEFISYHAINTSINLAHLRGKYPNYEGSEWSKGKLPNDLWREKRGLTLNNDMQWVWTRERLGKYGIRNGLIMAVAPTATISEICGCEQSIEPSIGPLYTAENLSGSFTVLNEHFVKRAKHAGIWSLNLVEALKQVNGDLSKLNNIPEDIKRQFRTVWQLDFNKIIECNAARQKWVDQAISFNVYTNNSSMKYLSDLYFKCWGDGLKTVYYCRSQGASKIEKSTVGTTPAACSIEAMKRGEICESCS